MEWRGRTLGSNHCKPEVTRIYTNMKKNFITVRVTEHWNRFLSEVVESPSLEIFKTRLDAVLCSLVWVTLLQQGVGLGDPQRALPTPTIL